LEAALKEKKVLVGLVGAGWPTWQHIKGYRKIEGVDVAALCDSDPARLERIADEYEIPKRYRSFDDMLVKERLHAVSICTPNHLHSPMTIQALEQGLHVLCEKPMATTSRDGRAMAEAAQKSGKVLMIAHMMRFFPNAMVLKDFIDKGELGELYFARAWWNRRNGIPGMGTWFTRKAESGGGALIDIGVHILDLALWFMGFPQAKEVTSSFGDRFAHRGKGAMSYGFITQAGLQKCDVEDFAVAHAVFDKGRSLFLQCSWASHIPSYDQGLEIWGEEGGARLCRDGASLEIFTERGGVPVDIQPQAPEGNPFDEESRHFIECIRQGTPPLCLPEEGIRVLELIEKIYQRDS
jgi:predicted dehydrogenase